MTDVTSAGSIFKWCIMMCNDHILVSPLALVSLAYGVILDSLLLIAN